MLAAGRNAVHGLCLLAVIAGLGVGIEALVWPSMPVRAVLACTAAGAAVLVIVKYLAVPACTLAIISRMTKLDSTALDMGRKTGMGDRLANALQVYEHSCKNNNADTSAQFAQQAMEEAAHIAAKTDIPSLVHMTVNRNLVTAGIAALILSILARILFPVSITAAGLRITHPFSSWPRPQAFYITALPGTIEAVEGDDIQVTASVHGRQVRELTLVMKDESGSTRAVPLMQPFSYTIKNMGTSMRYWFESGPVHSAEHTILVHKRPVVSSISVILTPPQYTGLVQQRLMENQGSFSALPGTRARFDIETSKPIQSAELVPDSGSVLPFENTSPAKAAASMIIHKPYRYHISVRDTSGIQNSRPIQFAVDLLADRYPRINIVSPGRDTDLGRDMVLGLHLSGSDDFGLSRCVLAYSVIYTDTPADSAATHYIPITLPLPGAASFSMDFAWNLDSLNLFPGDVVAYRAELYDNDTVSGPKKSVSSTYRARFPSVSDIFARARENTTHAVDSLDAVLETSRDMSADIERLSSEQKRKGSLSWEQQRQLRNMSTEQQQALDRVSRLSRQIQQQAAILQKQKLLSSGMLEKYRKLQDLFSEIDSPGLRKALERLSRAADKGSETMPVEDFQRAQQAFSQALDRTIAMVQNILDEQKLESLAGTAKDLHQRQEQVNTALEEKGADSSLIKEEEALAGATKKLQQDIEQAAESFKNRHRAAADSMRNAAGMMKRRDIAGTQKNMAQQMRQGSREQAASQGKEAGTNLEKLSSMLQQAKKSMQSSENRLVEQAMKRAVKNLLTLSQMQEQTAEQGKNQQPRQIAGSQLSVMAGLKQVSDSLSALSRKTFSLSRQLGLSLQQADQEMKDALASLEQKNFSMMRSHQKRAVGSLNSAAIQLQEAMEKQGSPGGPSGSSLDKMMQQIESMGKQQSALNRATADMLSRGRLSMEQQAAMSRLAAKQSSLQRMARQLADRLRNEDRVLGSLDAVAEDMEQVARDLKNGTAGSRTLGRQNRILSRLLDAQKSIRQQDFSSKRQSETGTDLFRTSPSDLHITPAEAEKLRRDILQKARAVYSPEYVKLIEEYFRALAKKQRESK